MYYAKEHEQQLSKLFDEL